MLQSLRKEKEGKLQMLLSLRKNGLTSLFKGGNRAFKANITDRKISGGINFGKDYSMITN